MIIRLRPWPQDPDEVCMERAAAADAAAAASRSAIPATSAWSGALPIAVVEACHANTSSGA